MRHTFFLFSIIAILLITITGCKDKQFEAQRLVREGNLYLSRSQPLEARKYFEKALSYNNTNVEALFGMGMSYANKQQYAKAITYFDQAIELKPDYMDAFYSRGQAYYYKGELHKACKDWYKAFDLGKPNIQDQLKMCP
jgi:tetratricopeptide (TPR) repeat protein